MWKIYRMALIYTLDIINGSRMSRGVIKMKWFNRVIKHESTHLEYKHPIASQRCVIIINHIVNWPQLRSEICINRLSWHQPQQRCRVIVEGIDWTYLKHDFKGTKLIETQHHLLVLGNQFKFSFDQSSSLLELIMIRQVLVVNFWKAH